MRPKFLLALVFLLLAAFSCEIGPGNPGKDAADLTIFFINDPHGELDNFAKIKHIVDKEKELTDVLLLSGGDIFSGNPIVDQYEHRGYPIIDIMNKTGFHASVIGNHEFDYGLDILDDRIAQATFPFVCANVDAEASSFNQPDPFITLIAGDLKITILGLVETFGKPTDVIPSTHPWRVSDISFQHYYNMVDQYNDLKEQEDADILMALTHLGTFSDNKLANEHPFFDLIIGGHSNDLNDGKVNDIPVLMAGTRLSHLGRIRLTIEDKKITKSVVDLLDLDDFTEVDEELMTDINSYNDNPEFQKVVGTATTHHNKSELGCFMTTAFRDYLGVDVGIQNSGGIRASLDEGDITKQEIYTIDPFNNSSVTFTMTAEDIKDFLKASSTGLHITGITIVRDGNDLILYDPDNNIIGNSETLTIGLGDYIPAVYDDHFNQASADIKDFTTAESLIDYLETMNSTVDFEGCDHYFRY